MENKDIKIKQGIISELVGRPARVSSTLVVMQGNNTQHQNVGQVLPDDKIKRHSRMSLSGIPTAFNNAQGGDPRQQPSGMTTPFKEEALNKNPFRAPLRSGFTLIELLVVILIIGILAAVALPQYQKAVVKNRLSALKAIVTPIANAAEFYYLQNGQYPSSLEDLDVSIPTPLSKSQDAHNLIYVYDWGFCALGNETDDNKTQQEFIACSSILGTHRITYYVYSPRTTKYPIAPACGGNTPLAIAVCQKETGITQPYYTNGTYKAFSYSKKSKV